MMQKPPAADRQTSALFHYIHSNGLPCNNVFIQNMHCDYGFNICEAILTETRLFFSLVVPDLKAHWCLLVIRQRHLSPLWHIPGLSPWAWGMPPATQWPPWQYLPAAAWLPGVGGRGWAPHTSVSTTEDGSSKPVWEKGEGERRHISHWRALVLGLLKFKEYFMTKE